jgi:hypothetical protein
MKKLSRLEKEEKRFASIHSPHVLVVETQEFYTDFFVEDLVDRIEFYRRKWLEAEITIRNHHCESSLSRAILKVKNEY